MPGKNDKIETALIAEYDFEPSPVVMLHGPRETSDGYFNTDRAVCACLDCRRTFDAMLDKNKPSGGYLPEFSGVCPDCGAEAPGSMPYMHAGQMSYEKDGTFRIDVPVSRKAHAGFQDDGAFRITDVISYRTVSVRWSGGHTQVSFDSGQDRIEYSSGRVMRYRMNQDGPEGRPGKKPFTISTGPGTPVPRDLDKSRSVRDWWAAPRHGPYSGDGGPVEWKATDGSDVSDTDRNFLSAKYAALARQYGLPIPSSEREYGRLGRRERCANVPDMVMENVLGMAAIYPGVFQREIERTNENLSYASKRGEDVSDAKARETRMEALSSALRSIYAMDRTVAKELSACRYPSEVTASLRAITFGDTSGGGGKRIKVSESEQDGYVGKYLKSKFNINPYMAAANAYTCRKLGVRDVNGVRALFEAGQSGGYPEGILPPIETRQAMGFMKMLSASRSQKDLIAQAYVDSHSSNMIRDSISMYKGLGPARLVRTKEEKARSDYLDFMNQARTFFTGVDGTLRSLDDFVANETFQRMFKGRVREIGQICYQEWERHPALVPNTYKQCRDGKPLFPNRTASEIHDELSEIGNRREELREDEPMPYTEKEREKVDRVAGGYDVHLVRSTTELWMAGNSTQTCVYASYRRGAIDKSTPIVLMTNPDGKIEAVAELTQDFRNIHQIKAFRNTALCGPVMHAAQEWMDETGIRPDKDGAGDVKWFGHENHYFHGNHNWHEGQERPLTEEEVAVIRHRAAASLSAEDFLEQHAKAGPTPAATERAAPPVPFVGPAGPEQETLVMGA